METGSPICDSDRSSDLWSDKASCCTQDTNSDCNATLRVMYWWGLQNLRLFLNLSMPDWPIFPNPVDS